MFTPERWAAAFINAAGDEADAAASVAIGEGLDLLRALSPLVSAIPGSVSGTFAATQLERMIHKALPAATAEQEIAVHFILLLIKKNLFRYIDAVIKEIEAKLDHLRGILPVTLESAAAPDEGFQESLKKQLMEKTGARGIKLDTRLVPDLLGGYRLRIGGDIIDASLRSQLQRMSLDLARGVDLATAHGGL
ncbi:hypothetical protein AGMMS49587_01970 [Spirochaetia bacterium]|nr:hypothetical protein AGMMS49587_01970 [Spirochaetia bacterium]